MLRVTINGKPMTERTFRNAIEAAAYSSVVRRMQERVLAAAAAEAELLTINIEGQSLTDLTFTISGPGAVVARVRNALAA